MRSLLILPALVVAAAASAQALTYSNSNLEVVKDLLVSEGASTTFTCQLPDEAQSVFGCQMATPGGAILTIAQGIVTDESGAPVPGYNGVDHGQSNKICGIEIASIASSDLGKQQLVNWTQAERLNNYCPFVVLQVTGNVSWPELAVPLPMLGAWSI